MRNPHISVAVIYDDPDMLELEVSAASGLFSGVIRTYVGLDEPQRLAGTLKGFPRGRSDVRELTIGNFSADLAGGGAHLQFQCTDWAGHAVAYVRLETCSEAHEHLETASFRVELVAADIDAFVPALHALSAANRGPAVLLARSGAWQVGLPGAAGV